jgi:hypothetical protein
VSVKLQREDWWILIVSLVLAILLPWWVVVLLPFLPLLLFGLLYVLCRRARGVHTRPPFGRVIFCLHHDL